MYFIVRVRMAESDSSRYSSETDLESDLSLSTSSLSELSEDIQWPRSGRNFHQYQENTQVISIHLPHHSYCVFVHLKIIKCVVVSMFIM